MDTWAYVFIATRSPKRTLPLVRSIPGVIRADALFGSPDIIAVVRGTDIAAMDSVIDRIAELPDVAGTDSKVARWLDGVGPPAAARG
jgi:DNA-binding Lrp family transcriptional regulator